MPNHELIRINLWLDREGQYDGLYVEPLGGSLYRVADIPHPWFGPHEIEYGDLVELERVAANTYEVRCVTQRGGWRRFEFLISPQWAASEAFERLMSDVLENGGLCVRDFGGYLSIVLPPDSTWDPTNDVLRGGPR
jgi:hypothetical protein